MTTPTAKAAGVSRLPTLDEITGERQRRQLCRTRFLPFVTDTHGSYDAQVFHRYIAHRMEAWANFETRFLQVVLPPRRGKSELGTRRLPAWNLGRNPDEKTLLTAHTQQLANSFSMDIKRILLSRRYRALFPRTRIPLPGQKSPNRELEQKAEWEIIGTEGVVRAAGTGVAVVGKGYRRIHVDDPFKNSEEAHSDKARDNVWAWYNDDVLSRGEWPYSVLLCNTRWHMDDLSGRAQREEGKIEDGGKWEVIRFPEMQDGRPRDYDPRKVGEMLWPTWFMAPWEYLDGTPPPDVTYMPEAEEPVLVTLDEVVARARANYDGWKGDRDAVLQGWPVAEGGNIIKLGLWEKHWERLPATGEWFIFCDPKGGSKDPQSSMAVIQLWFRPYSEPGNAYLVAQAKGLWDQPETLNAFRELAKVAPWKWAGEQLVENKADGKSIVAALKAQIPGLREYKLPGLSKKVRYRGAAPYWAAGNILLPPVDIAVDPFTGENWMSDFLQEHMDAPAGLRDDQIDTTTMAIFYFFIEPKQDGEETWGDWQELFDQV